MKTKNIELKRFRKSDGYKNKREEISYHLFFGVYLTVICFILLFAGIGTASATTIVVHPGESIQAAIDSLPPEGGTVELTEGTFDINPSTRIWIKRPNITLTGAGADKTTIRATEDITTKPMIQISIHEDIGQSIRESDFCNVKPEDCTYFNVMIKNLHILGHSTNAYSDEWGWVDNNAGIAIGYAKNLIFSNLWIENCGLGFQPNCVYYLLLENSLIEKNGAANTDSVVCSYSTFKNNIYRNALSSAHNFKLNSGWRFNEFTNNTIGPSHGTMGFLLYSASNDNLVENNTFIGNGAYGLQLANSYRNTIKNNVVASNSGRGGEGIIISSKPGSNVNIDNTITGNLIYNNEGIGIHINLQKGILGGKVRIIGNTIYGNGEDGIDAVRADFIIKNNIVTNNAGYGVKYGGIGIDLSYNDFWNNVLGNYNGVSTGTGDISMDPLFVDPTNGDFHLKSSAGRWTESGWVYTDTESSPCIDAGDPDADYANEPEPNGGRINMGAYGNTEEASKSGGLDTTPPTITTHSPTGASALVTTTITVTFSEAMNKTSSENAFSISPSVSGSFSWDGNKMFFTPSSNLAYETIYTVTISIQAEDLAGNNLESPFSWQFTTASEPTPPSPPIVYVATDGTGDYNCDGIDDQIEINEAIDYVATHDDFTTVHLKTGTYIINDAINLCSNLTFEGDDETSTIIKLKDQNNQANWALFTGTGISSTDLQHFTLDGNKDGQSGLGINSDIDAFRIYSSDYVNLQFVTVKNFFTDHFEFYQSSDCLVANCTSLDSGHDASRAIHCERITIADNYAYNIGNTGVRIYDSNDCVVERNRYYTRGYGIEVQGQGSGTYGGNIYRDNYLLNWLSGQACPGIMILAQGNTIIENEVFERNIVEHAELSGFKLFITDSGQIRNIDIINNVVQDSKSGINVEAGTNINAKNNILVNNREYGISGNVISSYNNVWGNPSGNYGGGASAGTGDISVDPLFADPANENFHLKSTEGRWTESGWVTDAVDSLCIDAGDPSGDYSNEPAPNGGRINMGAYGNTGEASMSATTGPDTTPPYTSDHSPAKDATGVSKDTNVVVHIKDDGEGVDQSSIVMTVEGIQVIPTITGTVNNYTLTYNPPSDFDYDQVVTVTIDAQDLASPPNVMTQDSYSFIIESAPDTTSPAKVTDLATSNPTSRSIPLTWTAPGDDGDEGTATEYDIRYSTSELTEANWDSATQCTDEPTPQIAGSAETFTVTGLFPDTTYYLALKAADEVPNGSEISNSPSAKTTEETDLVGEWHFDEGEGTTAGDSSEIKNDGTLTNMDPVTAWVDGKLGKGLEFDGSNDYVDCGNDPSLWLGTSDFTIEAWIKVNGDTFSGWKGLVDKGWNSDWSFYGLSGNTILGFGMRGIYSSSRAGAHSVTDGQWHHVAVVVDRDDEATFYVDGALDGATFDISSKSNENLGSDRNVRIGYPMCTNGYFNGIIDEVKIYRRALSAVEIREEYEAGSENHPPTAFIESIIPDPAEQGKDTVSISGHGNDTDGSVVAYHWSSSIDGLLSNASSFSKPASEFSVGTHTIYFKVQDDDGAWSTEVTEDLTIIEPANLAPVPNLSGPYTGTEGVPITFNGSGSYDPDGSIVSYEWDCGDGDTATGVAPTHTYAQNGTYNVSLTVTDNEGATNMSTTTAAIADTEPTADFSATPISGQEPLTVAFTDNSTSHDGIIAWNWDFNNDSVTDGTVQNPTHEYAEEGVYTVSLTVTESDGDSDTMTKADYITVTKANQPPISDPNGPYTGTEGVPIAFNGSGSYDPDGSIVAYEWGFGDGKNATGATPTHTYAQDGTYTVTLTVTDNDGATNTSTTTAAIADTEPTADFSATPISGQEQLTVNFTDNSTSHDGIVAWNWDFNNDGVTDSTVQNPTHVFADDGIYTVSLKVNESDGDCDSMTKADYITVTEVSQIEYIWLEAEDADILTPDFEIASDTSASNGKYIQIPEGVGWRAHDGEATYRITVASPGNYIVWGSKIAATGGDNSFFVQIEDGTEYLWALALSDNWQWDAVNHWGSGGEFDPEIDPVVFTLSAGEHTLRIKQREDGAKLDKLLITNNLSYVPALNNPPTAFIDSIMPDPAEQGKDTVSFTGHGTNTDGSIIAYSWSSSIDGLLSTASSFGKPASELSVGSHTIYFKVKDDDGAWSTEVTKDLTIIEPGNHPPYTPANPSPSDGAADVSEDADLSWSGGDPDAGDTVTYNVYFGTTTTPPLVAENQMGTTYDPGTLDHSTLYYWQIVATDDHGAMTEGGVWAFTTAAAPDTPPIVSNPSATPDTILNDNGRPRIPGTNISQLSVTVTDDTEVDTVTIDLSPIGGSYEAQMTNIPGTDTWTITMNAVEGINIAHNLIVTATDISGNFNNTVSISLTVLRRSDVFRDNIVDMKDVVYITRYLAGLEPERSNPPSVLVGDVVGSGGDPTGDGIVNMKDAVYIARYKAGWEDEP